MKKFFTVLIMVLCMQMPVNVAAQQIIVNDESGESVINGVIADIGYESFTLYMTQNQQIDVNIESLDLDEGRFDDYFKKGMQVQVIGNFDDYEFDANQIVKLSNKERTNILTDID